MQSVVEAKGGQKVNFKDIDYPDDKSSVFESINQLGLSKVVAAT